MAYPPGISLAVIQAGKAGTFFGDAASLTATVTPVLSGTKYLVHQSTGDLMVPSPMTFTAANDSVLSFSVPHVDQAGYLDDNAQAYTMWAYKVDVTVLIGNGRQVKKHTWTKNFQPLVGQDFIDIDQIASGVISEGVSAPIPPVTSFAGYTGVVTMDDLRAAGLGGVTDADLAAMLNNPESATGAAIGAQVNAEATEQIPPMVATALAADPTIADAAAAAVASEMVQAHLAYTITETTVGARPAPATGWTVARNGPMTFTATPKSGVNAFKGNTVAHRPITLPPGGSITAEFWARTPGAPTGLPGVRVNVLANFTSAGATYFCGVDNTGKLRVISGSVDVDTAPSTAVIADGNYHHVALTLTDLGDGTRKVTAAFLDGVTIDGSAVWQPKTAAVNAVALGGVVDSTSFVWGPEWSIDDLRISTGTRYTGPFTPPQTISADGTTILYTGFEPEQAGVPGYTGWPANAPAGAVTYVGTVEPTDWQTGDRWYEL